MKKTIFYALMLVTIVTNAQVRNYNGNKATAKPTTKTNLEKAVVKKDSYSDSDSESKFGIVAGLLISNEVGDEIETTSSRTGFYAGVSYQTNFSESLGLELNLVYATMGAQFNDEFKDEIDYLQVPITLNIKAFNLLKIQVGPQVGYLLSANFDGEDYSDTLNAIDYGVVAGLGVEFPNTNFGISGKFYYGLANINKDADSTLGEINNLSYSVGLFYNF